jgi:hypothetical protein
MLSLEEKQALLVSRWETLRKEKFVEGVRGAVKSLKSREVKPKTPTPPDESKETGIEKLSRAIWEASGRDLKSMIPPGVKNHNWYLLNLKTKGKIEWVGNVAIGEDSQFIGWVNVVPPHGPMICYFGPGAIDRARDAAQKISPYYK